MCVPAGVTNEQCRAARVHALPAEVCICWLGGDDLKQWVGLLERHDMHSDLVEEEVELPEEFRHGGNTESAEA